MSETMINILFCGIGGQGVLTASEACGWAAIFAGYHVKKSEIHGMAQRGGSVESHLRFGKEVFSPLIPKGQADFLVCFHRDEESRLSNFLKPKGKIISLSLNERAIPARYINSYMLGTLSRYLSIKEETWFAAIEKVFKNKNLAENKKSFLEGRGGCQ